MASDRFADRFVVRSSDPARGPGRRSCPQQAAQPCPAAGPLEVEQRQVGDHGAEPAADEPGRAASLAAADSNSGRSSASGAISLTSRNTG
jgi:hypothetical protein